jgi:hypothetical protein
MIVEFKSILKRTSCRGERERERERERDAMVEVKEEYKHIR